MAYVQLNDQTPFLDLSIVYGRNANEAQTLRAKVDGLLAVANPSETNNQEYPQILDGAQNCPIGGLTADRCLAGGTWNRSR